ncbi:MAG: DinB family protein, partial [Armatimonadota bacterium]|nr:DinB family protein [Armatimonadota bacterium]
MLPEIAEWWRYSRASREQFVQAVQFIPDEFIARRPAEGAPSALEIALHVCNADRVYCRMILEGKREIERITRDQCPDKETLLRWIDRVHGECEAALDQITPEMLA